MALWVATAVDIGFSARYRDDPRCLNPYPPCTTEAGGWLEGWDKADAQIAETARIVAEREAR